MLVNEDCIKKENIKIKKKTIRSIGYLLCNKTNTNILLQNVLNQAFIL